MLRCKGNSSRRPTYISFRAIKYFSFSIDVIVSFYTFRSRYTLSCIYFGTIFSWESSFTLNTLCFYIGILIANIPKAIFDVRFRGIDPILSIIAFFTFSFSIGFYIVYYPISIVVDGNSRGDTVLSIITFFAFSFGI